MNLDIGLGASFLAGIVSFLSPCILPLVPPYLCFLAGASLEELATAAPKTDITLRTVSRAAAFVIGFASVFVALGASATLIGRLLGEHLTALTMIAGIIIFLFGLHFLGLRPFPLLLRELRVHFDRKPAGIAGAFLIGLAFAFGWTPCVGPVLTSVLLMASTEDTAARGAMLLAAYALGIGVPFLLAAAFINQFIAVLMRFRRHLGIIEKITGAVLAVTGIVIFTGMMPVIGFWLQDAIPILGRIG